MNRKYSLQIKIFLLLTFVATMVISINSYITYKSSMQTYEQNAYKNLTAIREMKAGQIESYLTTIRSQINTLSNSRMIIDAMNDFKGAYKNIVNEVDVNEQGGITKRVKSYYVDSFSPKLSENRLEEVTLDTYIPKNKNAAFLQDIYIASNPNKTGEKHKLSELDNGTSYNSVHTFYHPIIRDYLEKFGYYDIFFVDEETGDIVYSVFKEVDFATSLLNGPYKDTNFAEVFKSAKGAKDKAYVKLVDYQPYAPSYDAPASFIASPIYDGDKKIGVLVFQMPVDKINEIMTNNYRWKDVGLGESGETYIVGEDYTLRNQSRFLIEDKKSYLEMIKDIGLTEEVIDHIDKLNNAIGLQAVKTKGTIAALDNKAGTEIFEDYRAVPVLSSYKPLKIKDVHWVIMSEIDEAEAFQDVKELRNKSVVLFFALLFFIIMIAILFAKKLTDPIINLQNSANELTEGNLDIEIKKESSDEIGDLAVSFNTMKNSIKKLLSVFDVNIISSKTDLKGQITYVSKAFIEISGFSKDELIGQPHNIVRHPEMPKETYTELWETIQSGKTWRGDIKNITKSGGFYWVDSIISPEFDDKGEISGYSAIRHDITSKKEIEELKENLEIKVEERTKEIKEAYDELDEYKNNLEIKVEEEIEKRQETMKIKERMEGELNVAHDIQMSMIPLLFPVFDDQKEFHLFATIKPAREVGGDFYDFYYIDDEHLGLVIGDVSGKGVPAALFMAVSKTLIKSRASSDLSPASILTYVNDEMSADNPASMFVTVWMAVLNIDTGELTYTNAGHNPPYIINSDNTLNCLTDLHGPIIGALDGLVYKESSIILQPFDKLVLFTDGVTEAMNREEELYGEKRLESYLVNTENKEVNPLVSGILSDVLHHEDGTEQSDDITILAFEYIGTDLVMFDKFPIENKIESLPLAIEHFEKLSEEYDIPMAISAKVNIILDDWLNNIISYGYEDQEKHFIDLEFKISGETLILIIMDDGIPFNPFSNKKIVDTDLSVDDRDIGGLGILLIKQLTNNYSYSRKVNKNVIKLEIDLLQK